MISRDIRQDIRRDDLDAAVRDGIIDAAQAVRIVHLARMRQEAEREAEHGPGGEPAHDPDDEKFRLIGGFNDVFVTIGVLLLVGAFLGLTRTLGFQQGFAAVALVVAWGLAEVFSRRMRLALPSIVLAAMFAGAAGFLGAVAGGMALDGSLPFRNGHVPIVLVAGGIAVVAAALVHERRFGVPVDGALAAMGAIAVFAGALLWLAPGFAYDFARPLTGLVGLAVFAGALRIDASDPERRTRRADIAFWLHLLAAPLIVHAVLGFTLRGMGGNPTGGSLLILALFAVLGLVAIVVDRRALLVSGLSYAGFAIAYLLSRSMSGELGLPLTLLGLAALVLALSAGWRRLRGAVVRRLPLGRLGRHLPPADPVRP